MNPTSSRSASPRLRVKFLFLFACLFMTSALSAQTTLPVSDPAVWSKGGASTGPATSVATTAEKTPDGQPAVQINYDIRPVEGKLAYAEFRFKSAPPLNPAPATATIWVKGDGNLHPLRLRFRDSTGRQYQWPLARTTAWTHWRKLTIELKPGTPGFNTWGGTGNTATSNAAIAIQPPFSFESFIVERRENPSTGSLQIGPLILE